MQIPEVLSDNWLLVLLAFLFLGPGAFFSKANSENFWVFGRLYGKFKSRHLDAVRAQETVSSAVEEMLRQQVLQLRQTLEDQLAYCGRTTAALERQIRESRADAAEIRAYAVMLKRWVVDTIEDTGGDITKMGSFPDFEVWRRRFEDGDQKGQ